MPRRHIAAAALVAALSALPAWAGAEILVVPPTPTQGERAVITLMHAGTEAGNTEVQAIYRPGSKVSRTQIIGKTRLDGRLTWIPEGAGIVTLQAVVDSTAMSKNLSVRFRGVPLSGLVILIGAGIILYGGVLWGFLQLAALPPQLPPDT